MTKQEIQAQLENVFKQVFNQEIKLSDKTTANDVESWDSLNHVILMKAIEERFEIEFDLFEMIDMKSVGDIIDAIQTKLDAGN